MLSYCGELVRKHDPDRFFMSLMQPADRREALWALYAFNYEIAKTREVVTDTTLGLIRLQWWRDGIAEIYDGKDVRQNEILPTLAQAIKDYDLPQKLFEDLCYAREFDLEGVIPADMAGLLKPYVAFDLVSRLKKDLDIINTKLWNIEDKIREKESEKNFDDEFIKLARNVYITNDKRSSIKNKINISLKSKVFEVKSYKNY